MTLSTPTQADHRFRTYFVVWIGQTSSIIGSRMTQFALALYVFELTGNATSIALFGIVTTVPMLIITLFSGALVDRFRRKRLMMMGDSVAGCSTIVLMLLLAAGKLEIWHIYVAYAFNSPFEVTQMIAFQAASSMMVDKRLYARISAMTELTYYAASIIGPALAAPLFASGGLGAVFAVDVATLLFAVSTVRVSTIPELPHRTDETPARIREDLKYGFRYIWERPALMAFVIVVSLHISFNILSDTVWQPLVLARNNNNEHILAATLAASGVGGGMMAILVSLRGIPRFARRAIIMGVFMTMFGLGKTAFGLSQIPVMWMLAACLASTNVPIWVAAMRSIQMSKVAPSVQGRVFASITLVRQVGMLSAQIAAPVIADTMFEPGMKAGGVLAPIFGPLFGTEVGAGYSLMFAVGGLGMFAAGATALLWRQVRDIDTLLPDYELSPEEAAEPLLLPELT